MKTRTSGAVVTAGALAAVFVTCVTGQPASLPEIALGSPVLFHLERVIAILAA
jgi:hypothetical protein